MSESSASRPAPAVNLRRATADVVAGAFDDAAAKVGLLDQTAMDAADARQLRLTKPPGSLGRLETIARQLCGIAATCPPPIPAPAALAVFAGNHGVVAEGVTPWPSEVTAQMVDNFVAGGAAVTVMARQLGVAVTVVDAGVAPGTANLRTGPAMTDSEVSTALDLGATVAAELVAEGSRVLLTGEMGIGNTTPAAAIIAACTGGAANEVTDRGTGIDDERLRLKTQVVSDALQRAFHDGVDDAVTGERILAEVGGYEIAALVGFIIGAAAARVPVVVDGVIANAALLVAARISSEVVSFCIAGHRSSERGASRALAFLEIDPVLDLGLRLGEGTGAVLALSTVEAAARTLGEMATFDDAGVVEG